MEKTNRFLNEFAKCALDKKPFSESVDKVNQGLKPPLGATPSKAVAPKKPTPKSKPVPGSNKRPTVPKTTESSKASPKAKSPVAAQQQPKVELNKIEERKEDQSEIRQESLTNADLIDDSKEIDDLDMQKTDAETKLNGPTPDASLQPEPVVEDKPASEPVVQIEDNNQISENSIGDVPRETLNEQAEILNAKPPDVPTETSNVSRPLTSTTKRINHHPAPVEESSVSQEHDNLNVKIETRDEPEIATPAPLLDESVKTERKESSRFRGSAKPQPRVPSSVASPVAINQESVAVERPPSIKKQSRKATRSSRPSSSRPAPPRVMTASRSRLSQLMENRMEQFVSGEGSNTMTTPLWPPPASELTTDADSDEYVISSKKLQESLLNDQTTKPNLNGADSQDGDDKGLLVQQLLATKSELEGKISDSGNVTNNENGQEMFSGSAKLKTFVQQLCQSVGTLSKALNYLHEDIEPMVAELVKWRDEYRGNVVVIRKIRSDTQKELEPLKKELQTAEKEVADFAEQLQMLKMNVFRNSQTVDKLIGTV